MKLKAPYPPQLMQVARKVVWYDPPEQTLADLPSFLANLMVYGNAADLEIAGRYIPEAEFRQVLASAPAGTFTIDSWKKWHERFDLPVPELPRRRFPDGSLGPEPGAFRGR